jgi:ubiquinone biosynthesis protein UbiJ
MFSFFVGLATGFTILMNGQKVRLGLVRTVLAGAEVAKEAGQGARRLTARVVEDFEDAVAEVKAEQTQAGTNKQNLTDLAAQLKQFREEIGAMEAKKDTIQ